MKRRTEHQSVIGVGLDHVIYSLSIWFHRYQQSTLWFNPPQTAITTKSDAQCKSKNYNNGVALQKP